MRIIYSPWMLVFSQGLGVLLTGWIQWNWIGSVTLTVPLMALVVVLYVHQRLLQSWDRLPQMPRDIKLCWGIALCWSALLVLTFVFTQSAQEVGRVAKVLPVLWLGIGLMDWVLLVCMLEIHKLSTS